jgi:hypothetical protein
VPEGSIKKRNSELTGIHGTIIATKVMNPSTKTHDSSAIVAEFAMALRVL